MKPLQIYVHIPFCVSKCQYCDFLSYVSKKEERRAYVKSLCQEIEQHQFPTEACAVSSIFVGGGTPSILEEGEMSKIFAALRKRFLILPEAEITVEMNPESVTIEKLVEYQKIGVNRLSLGLQSTKEKDLKRLGRVHTVSTGKEAYKLAKEMGFSNVNLDLMSALPNQTLEDWKEILSEVVALAPEHLSTYSLILEEGTPFFDYYQSSEARRELPQEEVEREMYWWTKEYLEKNGYRQYEISNYAKEGYECRHNLGYWDMVEYLGFGKGAASFFENKRWGYEEERRALSKEEWMEEYMFLGLRKTKGVSKSIFLEKTHHTIGEIYGNVLKKLYEQQLLEENGDWISLTRKGLDVSNQVFAEFLL